jgi:hypothetical protein
MPGYYQLIIVFSDDLAMVDQNFLIFGLLAGVTGV